MTKENTEKLEEKNDTPNACESYADKLWDAEKDEEVSAHISSCENCRKEAEKISKIKEALNGLYTPDESLSTKLDTALEKAPQKKKGFRVPKHFGTAAAAVLIVFVLGISGFFQNSDMFLKESALRSNEPSPAESFKADEDGQYYVYDKNDAPCITFEEEERLPACEPSYSPDSVKNNGFNYIAVKGITKNKLISALSENDIEIKTDITVSSEQIALAEKDIEKAEKLLKTIGAVIISADGGKNAAFTLIEIRK